MQYPSWVAIKISSLLTSSISPTKIISSSSFVFIAIKPELFIFLNSPKEVFFIKPFLVINTTSFSGENSFITIVSLTFSPSERFIILLNNLPLDCLDKSGIS